MKIFISCPITGLCDKSDSVKDEFRTFFKKLRDTLDRDSVEYFMAITSDWKNDFNDSETNVYEDFTQLSLSDMIIAIPWICGMQGSVSPGVCVELGWASSLKKDLHILVSDAHKYSPMIFGLSNLTNTNYYKFNGKLNDLSLKIIENIINTER